MSDIQGLGAVVADNRRARKWTLKDVADYTGLSIGYLSDIERGRARPTIETLTKLATAFDIEPGELLNVANTLTGDEHRLLQAWRADDWRTLMAMVTAKIAEVYGD